MYAVIEVSWLFYARRRSNSMVISSCIDRKFHAWLNTLWLSAHNARYFQPGHSEQIKVCTSEKLPVCSWLIREHRGLLIILKTLYLSINGTTVFRYWQVAKTLQREHQHWSTLQSCEVTNQRIGIIFQTYDTILSSSFLILVSFV